MRVSDLVKDVIFLVGSMECFSQVRRKVAEFLPLWKQVDLFMQIPNAKRGCEQAFLL